MRLAASRIQFLHPTRSNTDTISLTLRYFSTVGYSTDTVFFCPHLVRPANRYNLILIFLM
jgi:hypothetical protein